MNTSRLQSFIRGPLVLCCFISIFLGAETGRADEGVLDDSSKAVAAAALAEQPASEEGKASSSERALLKIVDENKLKSVEIFEDGDTLIIRKSINGEDEEVTIAADSIAGSIAFSILDELAAEGIIHDDEALLDLSGLGGEGIRINVEDDSESVGEVIIGILAITLIFGGPIIIVGLVLFSRYRRRKLLHESMNKLIDSGRDIPDNLFNEIEGTNDQDQSLRKGMTSTGLGIALIISLSLIADPTIGSLGLIPLMIGLAHLLIWKVNSNKIQSQA